MSRVIQRHQWAQYLAGKDFGDVSGPGRCCLDLHMKEGKNETKMKSR